MNEPVKYTPMDAVRLTSGHGDVVRIRSLSQDRIYLVEDIDPLLAMGAKLREAAQVFADRLAAIHEDPEYKAVWELYANHAPQGYQGPKYVREFDDLLDALHGGKA
ncbi:hypothetical protein M0R72_13600 [Candidatus Pacearchaeota archaeon]|jgi:hypothetical protein|nr:hypothetical protein [Candidatus Pacearchaeota archaeon]